MLASPVAAEEQTQAGGTANTPANRSLSVCFLGTLSSDMRGTESYVFFTRWRFLRGTKEARAWVVEVVGARGLAGRWPGSAQSS